MLIFFFFLFPNFAIFSVICRKSGLIAASPKTRQKWIGFGIYLFFE